MRKIFVVLVAAALMFTLPGAAGAATKKFEVTLRQTPSGAVIISECGGAPTGAKVKLTGTVSPTRAGKTIKIYQRIEGRTAWKLEGSARIRSSGRYVFYDRPTTPATREYQARMPTVGSYHGAYSPKVTVDVRDGSCVGTFDVTVKTDERRYEHYYNDGCIDEGPQWEGNPVRIRVTGTVSPIRAGKYVSIYKKFDGRSGKLEGKARVRSSGRFTYIDRPTSKKARSYKAKMPSTGSWAKGFSPYTRVTIEGYCED